MLVKFMSNSRKLSPLNKKLLIQRLVCYLGLFTSEKLSSMIKNKLKR